MMAKCVVSSDCSKCSRAENKNNCEFYKGFLYGRLLLYRELNDMFLKNTCDQSLEILDILGVDENGREKNVCENDN